MEDKKTTVELTPEEVECLISGTKMFLDDIERAGLQFRHIRGISHEMNITHNVCHNLFMKLLELNRYKGD